MFKRKKKKKFGEASKNDHLNVGDSGKKSLVGLNLGFGIILQ